MNHKRKKNEKKYLHASRQFDTNYFILNDIDPNRNHMTKLTNYAVMLLNKPRLTVVELLLLSEVTNRLAIVAPTGSIFRLIGEHCRDSYILMDN